MILEIGSGLSTYSLRSDLEGGDIELFTCQYDEIGTKFPVKTLFRGAKAWNPNTLSSFLLGLINLGSKSLLKSYDSWKKRELHYSDLRHLFFVDETVITKRGSPILTDQATSKTVEESAFKFLMTWKDDSGVKEGLDKKELANKKGRLAVLEEMIQKFTDDELWAWKTSSYQTIEEIEEEIRKVKTEQEALRKEISDLDSKRRGIDEALFEIEKTSKETRDMLARSEILRKQYASDKMRLKATIEAAEMLEDWPHEEVQCPLCRNAIDSQCDDALIKDVISAGSEELEKINWLADELEHAIEILNADYVEQTEKVGSLQSESQELKDLLTTKTRILLNQTGDKLGKLFYEKNAYLQNKYIHENAASLRRKRDEIEKSMQDAKLSRDDADDGALKEFCEFMKEMFNQIGWDPKVERIEYDKGKDDFIIDGRDRWERGKWYRAISYSIFIISLVDFLLKKGNPSWIAVIDSPITTYKSRSRSAEDSEKIPDDMAKKFYDFLWKRTENGQIIIIENRTPPSALAEKVNVIEFTWRADGSRYGFFPKKMPRRS